MRPHQLTMTAFGPYAGTVHVDLDRLAEAGLFLLHGPTGAGKTTLLDGIGFALFGRVPGARGKAKRLRSDHADPMTRTQVQLEATLGGRRLRVTRSPAWERAKTRGTGTTTEPARVLLEEQIGARWVTVSPRAGEADQEIADLLGMSAEQFFQVVLLPQGEFATFLRADNDKRAELLERLFSTERFGDVEQWLARRRRASSDAVAQARAEVDQVVARLAEVADADIPEHVTLDWARAHADAATARELVATARVQDLTVARDTCRAELDAARALQARQQRRAAALQRQQQLALQRPTVLALQAETDAAARAAECTGALEAVASRRSLRDDALAAELTARAQLPGLEGLASLQQCVADAQERAGRLSALEAVEAALVVARAEASRARAEQADALAAVATCEVALVAVPARRADALTRVEAAREAQRLLPGVRAQRDQLAALRPDVVQLAQVRTAAELLADQVADANRAAASLLHKAAELRVSNVDAMVARLAARLADGVPCEVCGSVEHPDPSAMRDTGISTEDEEQAVRAAEAAEAELSRLKADLAAAEATRDTLAERVGAVTLVDVDAQVAALDVELAALGHAVSLLGSAEADLTDLDQQRADLAQQQVVQTTRADAADRRAGDAEARAALHLHALTAELGDDLDAGVAAAVAQVTSRRTAALALLDAVQRTTAATDELRRAVAEAEAACTAAGFASPEDARAAARDAGWRETARDRLQAATAAAAALAADLADPALDVPLDPPAPVEHVTLALARADDLLSAAMADLGDLRGRRLALERLVPDLTTQLDVLAPLEATAGEVRRLADLCGGIGQNALKMTLSSFVLAARLEEVADAASGRLLRMTQGRYSLVHTDGGARGNARSGLGLLVRDGWSGQDRDTSTLSGGETFLAALALALGLADVVAAEAGGARIGALFVDEGFGTLDEDTLDEVMDVLDSLREGGRIVGLVSHVSDLRQRIPAQVQVTKTRTGSDLRLVGC